MRRPGYGLPSSVVKEGLGGKLPPARFRTMSSSPSLSLPAFAGTHVGVLARVRRLMPALLVLILAVLTTSNANAAVPMCSEDGRSIVAPPIMAPNRGLVLEAPRPCPQPVALLIRSVPSDPGGQPTPPSDGPIRAVPVRSADLPSPRAAYRERDDATLSTGLELAGTVERPPRH